MATAPKIKPAKVSGNARKPAPARKSTKTSAPTGQSIFEDALRSVQEDLAIELEKDLWACERSTQTAVDGVQPTEKLSTFHSGFDGWLDKLCASAEEY